MNFNEIKELIKLIDSTNLDYVKLENDSLKLEVSKNDNIKRDVMTIGNGEIASGYQEPRSEMLNKSNADYEYEFEYNDEEYDNDENLYIISAPLMGTFYNSPNPDSDVFVKVGDKVEEGQTLCILEAMKLMNEINSEVSGEIVEVLVENETLVEYNQPLFKIKQI